MAKIAILAGFFLAKRPISVSHKRLCVQTPVILYSMSIFIGVSSNISPHQISNSGHFCSSDDGILYGTQMNIDFSGSNKG